MNLSDAITEAAELRDNLSTVVASGDKDNTLVAKAARQVDMLEALIGASHELISTKCNTAYKNNGKCMGWYKDGRNEEPLDMCKECDKSAYYGDEMI